MPESKVNQLKYVAKTILKFFKVRSPLKTLYINFKMLPFNQAIKFPILVYGNVIFRSMKGRIILTSDKIRPGMIGIGSSSWYPGYKSPVILTLDGTMIIEEYCPIGMGAYILIARGGIADR